MGYLTNGLSFHTLRDANSTRRKRTPKFKECEKWIPAQWLQALIGELGEFANLHKKVERGDLTLDEAREALGKELADVQIYLDILAAELDVDLSFAVEQKFNEVSERVGADVFIDGDDWHYRKIKNA